MPRAASTVVLVAMTTATAWAQAFPTSPGQRYVLVLWDRLSAIQLALNDAAAKGWEVKFGNDQGLFLTRVPTPATSPACRAVLENRSDRLEQALNLMGAQGLHAIPLTVTRAGSSTVAVLCPAPGPDTSYRYRVLSADELVDKNLNPLLSQGFSLAGVFTEQSGGIAERLGRPGLGRPGRLRAIFEAADGGPVTDAPADTGARFRVVSATRTPTMEKELNEAAAEGYAVKGGSFMNVLLETRGNPSPAVSYRVIGANRGTTLQEELRQAGRLGYRVVPSSIMKNPSSKLETAVVMENARADSRAIQLPALRFVTRKRTRGV